MLDLNICNLTTSVKVSLKSLLSLVNMCNYISINYINGREFSRNESVQVSCLGVFL